MRAIVSSRYGSADALRLEDIPKPVPGDDELLVRVVAATVNRTDCGFLSGKPALVRLFTGIRKPKNPVLGNEFAGEVEAVGKDVVSFSIGQRVFGYDGSRLGSHAEYKTVAEHGLVAEVPAGMSYDEIVPTTEGAHYALNLIRAARISAGTKVLVNGATGAIGSAAVQLLKHAGADVTAVCDTDNVELVQSLGADRIVDYTKDDFTKLDEVFDVILDAVGKSSFTRCRPLLKPGGLYLSSELGFLWQNPIRALLTQRSRRTRVKFPIPRDKKEDVVFLKELVEAGKFRPVIDRSYSLEQVPEAYGYVESGKKIGNVVIRVVQG
jgi:NADPH:quinone reductase-like Zn-dependent oxidoreductase